MGGMDVAVGALVAVGSAVGEGAVVAVGSGSVLTLVASSAGGEVSVASAWMGAAASAGATSPSVPGMRVAPAGASAATGVAEDWLTS